MSRGKTSTRKQLRPAGGKPWFRSTVFVCFVSLIGSLTILGAFDRLSSLVTPIPSEEFGFDDLSGQSAGVLGDGGIGSTADRALFEAADMFSLGNEEYAAGNLESAKQRFEEAVRFNPQHSFAWANLGNVQRDLRDTSEAVQSHRQAVDLLPTRARHWYNLGVSLYSNGRASLPEAIEAFQAALRLNDGMGAAHFNLGVALAEQGRRAEAKAAYERAVAAEPNSQIAHGARCNMCNLILSSSSSSSPPSSVPEGRPVSVVDGSSGGGLWAGAQCLRRLLEEAPHYERAHVNLAGTLHTLADAGSEVLQEETARVAAAAAVAAEASERAKQHQQQQQRLQVEVDEGAADVLPASSSSVPATRDAPPHPVSSGGDDDDAAATTRSAAVAAAAASATSLTPRSLLREARRHYKKALELNPSNAIASHALTALEAAHADTHFRTKKQHQHQHQTSGAGSSSSTGDHDAAAAAQPASSSNSNGNRAVPSEAPADYVGALFDSYAVEFDASLRALGYQVPSLLRRAVGRVLLEKREGGGGGGGKRRSSLRPPSRVAVDLGCGTGLCGPWIKGFARRVVGVDLSSRMLEIAALRPRLEPRDVEEMFAQARADAAEKLRGTSGSGSDGGGMFINDDEEEEEEEGKEDEEEDDDDDDDDNEEGAGGEGASLCYDELVNEDIGAALLQLGQDSVDLVVAADVLCYLGDLRRVFVAARIALQAHGLFAFTVEAFDDSRGLEESPSPDPGSTSALGAVPAVASAAATPAAAALTTDGAHKPSVAPPMPPGGLPTGGGVSEDLSRLLSSSGGGWRIDSSGRYRHRKDYMLALAEANGFLVALHEKVVARRRHSSIDAEPVEAYLFVLEKAAGPPRDE